MEDRGWRIATFHLLSSIFYPQKEYGGENAEAEFPTGRSFVAGLHPGHEGRELAGMARAERRRHFVGERDPSPVGSLQEREVESRRTRRGTFFSHCLGESRLRHDGGQQRSQPGDFPEGPV